MEIKKINIFSAFYVPHVGGVEKFTSFQKREFEKLGFKVNIITSNSEGSDFYEQGKDSQIFRLSAIKSRIPIPYNPFQMFKAWRKSYRGEKSLTIVHTRYYPISLLGVFMGWISRSPTIVLDHSSGYVEVDSPLVTKVLKMYEHITTFIMKLFRPRFFGVSQTCNTWLKNFRITASGVYYNGVDYNYKIPKPIDVQKKHKIGKYIIFSGRFIEEKGIIELLKAFDKFSKNNLGYHLLIAGSGPLEAEIEKHEAKNDHIILLGRLAQDDMYSYIKDSWCLVNPSNYPEGLPTVLLEAGKFGTAVISTPNGGAKEVIVDNETGILISSGKANLIEKALIKLSQDQKLRDEMANNFQQLIKNKFDWSIITKDFVSNNL